MKNTQQTAQRLRAEVLSRNDVPDEASGFDWNDLKYFLAVAREGGLSKAGLLLGSSASTVSRHIAALERHLHVRLFVRLSTGYVLTDAGSELFERVAEVERRTHAVARGSSVAAEQRQVTGLVRLATADSIGTFVLVPHLATLRARHPGLRVELLMGHAQVDLTRREADVALRILDAQHPVAHPDHVMHRIGPIRFDLYAVRAMLQGVAPEQVDWRRLDHVGWDSGWRHLPLAQWLSAAFERPAAFSSNSMTVHLSLIRAGVCAGMLPRYMAATDPSLVRLPAEDAPGRELWLVYHRDLRDSLRVQAMRRFIEEVVPAAILA